MTKFLFIFVLVTSLITDHSSAQQIYDGTIGEKEILTPLPKKSPRINGPKVYGAHPGKKILYRIPCQGERPVQFSANGIPEGLILDPVKGIISGVVSDIKGEYRILFRATNIHGTDSREFRIIVGDKLALTPPTGWNHWGGHLSGITAKIIEDAAAIIHNKGLADVGYQYISIDDCWMRMSPEEYNNILNPEKGKAFRDRHKDMDYDAIVGETRDSEGKILSNKLFPDMKALAGHIHSYGLKAGIYSGPGIMTCQHMAGSLGHELQDAGQYAAWGYDLLKYDLCAGREQLNEYRKKYPGYQQKDFWKPMALFVRAQDRDIQFNLCQYGNDEPWKWAPELGIQSWRTGGDLNHNVGTYFKQAVRLATELREYSKPGQWNDPDFLYVGKLGNHLDQLAPSRDNPLTTNQRYQYVTLWSMISAPFFFSCDIYQMDDFTVGLLSNAGVLNINQDELGHVAEVVRDNENETVMVKNLADGAKVLALFNRNAEKEATINVQWKEVDGGISMNVFDVWRQKEIGAINDGISVKLSPDGVALLMISHD